MIHYIYNLKFSLKMLVLGVLAFIAITIPSIYSINYKKQEIASSLQETAGLKPADQLLATLIDLQLHRGLFGLLLSGQSVDSQRQTKAMEASTQLKELQASWQSSGLSDSDLPLQLDDLQQQWMQLQQQVGEKSLSSAESFKKHEVIIETLLQQSLNSILESSGLSYDPVAETYHLVIAGYQNSPRMIEAIAMLRGLASSVIADKQRGESAEVLALKKNDLRAYLTLFEQPYIDLKHNLEAASKNSDETHIKQLANKTGQLQSQIEEFLKILDSEAFSSQPSQLSSEQFFQRGTTVIDAINVFNEDISKTLQISLQHRTENSTQELQMLMTQLAILGLAFIGIGLFMVRDLNINLKAATATAMAISRGDFQTAADTKRKDEVGRLAHELFSMNGALQLAAEQATELQQRAAQDAERAKLDAQKAQEDAIIAQANTRIRQALDESSTNVMIADNDRKIIYTNKSVIGLLSKIESQLAAVIPNFRVSHILGSSMDIFYQSPQNQTQLITDLNQMHTANITLGGLHIRVLSSPIRNDAGEKLGTIVEWINRTAEVKAEQEIAHSVGAAAQGDFSVLVPEDDKQGFFLDTAKQLNSLIKMSDSSLEDINNVLRSLANGDLTLRVQGNYFGAFEELKINCNQSCENLALMITDMSEIAQTIHIAGSEIVQGNTDLSSRTEQQASSLEETASSMEELTSTVRQNADNARQANTLAAKASDVAVEGGSLIDQVVKTMAAINESAQKISDIIGVIDGIAFQTNILALNAAVEAARAGEQGRGFAVVASEVRTLAQRSANAAKDIKALISDSVSKINSGNELVGKSGNTMREIVVSIKRVNDIMAEIAAASTEQSAGLDEVGKAVVQMDEMTQQNAALVEEATAAAESLLSQSEQLARNVARFTLDDEPPRVAVAKKVVTTAKKQLKAPPAKPAKKLMSPAKPDEDEWESF